MSAPREPSQTCPTIDAMIRNYRDSMEDIRQANMDIREWGQWHVDRVEELEIELRVADEEIASIKAELDALGVEA